MRCMFIVTVLSLAAGCGHSLKCYQCTTMGSRNCLDYNLGGEHLKECKNDSLQKPVCRVLSQEQHFTGHREMAVVRECAFRYERPLKCARSRFSSVHYSECCECDVDGCNHAVRTEVHLLSIMLMWLASAIKP